MNFASINAPLEDMSEFAIENLIKSINGEDYKTEYKGLISLIIRDSVKNLKNQ